MQLSNGVILGNTDLARKLQEEAVSLARPGRSALDLARHIYNEAGYLFETCKHQAAIDKYEEAFDLLRRARSRISDKHLRDHIMEQYRPGYHRLARLHMAKGAHGAALGVLEEMAAVGLNEFMAHPPPVAMSSIHTDGEFIGEFPLPPLDEKALWSTLAEPVPTVAVRYAFVEDDLCAFLALPNHPIGDWVVCTLEGFGYLELAEWFLPPPKPPDALGGGWFGPLHDFRGAMKGHVVSPGTPKDEFVLLMRQRLIDAWEPMLADLGSKLFAPIVSHLRRSGVGRLLFVPVGVLAHVPLHAMQWQEGNRSITVIDEFEVHYAPSLRVFMLSAQRPVPCPARTLVIADPTDDLPLARAEGRMVSRMLPSCQLLEGSNATFEEVRRLAHACTLLHCATHASYDATSADLCGICLSTGADSEKAEASASATSSDSVVASPAGADYHLATVPQIFGNLAVAPGALVVLSACDSGVTLPDFRGEDFVSLSAAFLVAGASGVICSQWPVGDMTAALFMLLLYSGLGSKDAAAALAAAQRRLRSISAEDACRVWNSYGRDMPGWEQMTTAKLEDVMGFHFENTERPFACAYFWASFGLWGRAHPPAA